MIIRRNFCIYTLKLHRNLLLRQKKSLIKVLFALHLPRKHDNLNLDLHFNLVSDLYTAKFSQISYN